MRLTGLADACRAAGLTVVEWDGWQQRGRDLGQVGAVLAHHTATGPNVSDAAVARLLRDGRPDLPGPLCQVGLDRRGRVHLIAAGCANHAGAGSWQGVSGNSRAVGVEAFNDGAGEPWPVAQLAAWDRLNAVLLRLLGLPADRLCGHKEWAPTRKVDPRGLDMRQMRARAAALLTQEDDMFTDEDRKRLERIANAVEYGLIPADGEGDFPGGGSNAKGELTHRLRAIHALVAAMHGRDATAIAAAIPADLAKQVADELSKRLAA